jgi:hypothetical protein
MAMNVKFLQGSSTNFNKITTKEANTFYYVTDKKALYLGANLIGDGVSTEAFEALKARVKTLEDWKTLLATETSKTSASTTSIPDLIAVTVKTKDGAVSGVSVNDSALRTHFSSYVTTVAHNSFKEDVSKTYVTNETYNAHLNTQDNRDDGQDELIAGLRSDLNAITEVGGEPNKVDDVKIGSTSIVSGKIATIAVDGTYNASSNKIATASTVTNAIANLDATKDNGNNDLVKVTVVETDGKLTSVTVDDSKLDTALAGKAAKAYEGKVDTLIGSDASKSVRAIAAEEIAAQLIPSDAKDALNTLEEIAAWIQDHPDDASAMSAAIEALKKEVGGTYVAGTGFTNSRIDALETSVGNIEVGLKSVAIDNFDNNQVKIVIESADGTEVTDEFTVAYASTAGNADNANYALEANYASNAGNALEADSASNANYALEADYASNAGNADTVDNMHASDFATAAQGSTADSALQEVTIAGNKLTKTNSTISKETISAALNLTGGEGSFDARIVIAQETADNINIDLATNYKTWSNTKTAIQGNTDVTVEEAVIAINKLSTGAANQNATIGNINSNVDAIVDQLTWGTF